MIAKAKSCLPVQPKVHYLILFCFNSVGNIVNLYTCSLFLNADNQYERSSSINLKIKSIFLYILVFVVCG